MTCAHIIPWNQELFWFQGIVCMCDTYPIAMDGHDTVKSGIQYTAQLCLRNSKYQAYN